jgi:hypothetical protein
LLTGDQRISIFIGGFGSGKTEISINYALRMRDQGKAVKLVDLDVIDPYFRVREQKESLESKGIEVISPAGKLAGADLPALPPAIYSIFNSDASVVIDVGGDDIGSVALGRFREQLKAMPCNVFFVVNTCRPGTNDVAGIVRILAGIEETSRLQANALICNTNLGRQTDVNTILAGFQVVSSAAERLAVPVAFIAARRDLAGQLNLPGVPVLPLDIFMKPPWEIEQQ